MPYFNWIGVDWNGDIQKGIKFAKSEEDLKYILLNEEIGLIKAKLKEYTSIFNPIKLSLKVQFFKELSILLESGILLPKALNIIQYHIKHKNFKKIVEEIQQDITQGISISVSIVHYQNVFDNLTIQIIKSGNESGNLSNSLKLLSLHLEKRLIFLSKLKSSLILPIITFILFIIISLIIFVVVIPIFSSLLISNKQELSILTLTFFNISSFLQNKLYLILLVFIAILLVINFSLKNKKVKSKFDILLIKLPLIGNIIKYNNIAHFFQSSALLLDSGISLIESIEVSLTGFSNFYLKNIFQDTNVYLKQGSSLSSILQNYSNELKIGDIVEMIKVAEESGKIGYIFNQISIIYYEKSYKLINLILFLLQPLLMLVLGLLIALLIFAIYIPIFNLSNVLT